MTAGIALMGITMGMAGSLHCIGMCGPLALALPINNKTRWTRFLSGLAYNTGRTLTYFLMGVILGWAGSRLVMTGYQQLFSVICGALILVSLTVAQYLPEIKTFKPLKAVLKKQISKIVSQTSSAKNLFLLGMLNGLLPCGLSYAAVASALIIGGPLASGTFMAFFGLGTIPLMLALMLGGQFLSFSVRARMKRAVPFFIGAVAVLMILRGLNLGIPYVSPAFHSVAPVSHCSPSR